MATSIHGFTPNRRSSVAGCPLISTTRLRKAACTGSNTPSFVMVIPNTKPSSAIIEPTIPSPDRYVLPLAQPPEKAIPRPKTNPPNSVAIQKNGAMRPRPIIRSMAVPLAISVSTARHSTELMVVDQVRNGRLVSAHRTVRVAPDLHLPELHPQRIEEQEAPRPRIANPEQQFDRLNGLQAADDPAQHTQHAGLLAARNKPWGRRRGVQAAIAALTGKKDRNLSFELEDTPVHKRLLQKYAGVVDQVSGRKVVTAIDHHIVLADHLLRVLRGEERLKWLHLDIGIDLGDRFNSRDDLRSSHIIHMVKNLAQIGRAHV